MELELQNPEFKILAVQNLEFRNLAVVTLTLTHNSTEITLLLVNLIWPYESVDFYALLAL